VAKKGNCWPELLVFYSPWGSERDEQAHRIFAPRFLLSCKKKALRIRPQVPAFRLTPIRVREKRMNTLKTAKTGRSYQNVNK
jgi:hypothetical protein